MSICRRGFVKIISIITIFILISCQGTRAPASANNLIDIVFDLDWTLIKQLKRGESLKGPNIITYNDELYRVNDGAIELLSYLSKRDDVRLSFFSGGGKLRNESVLKKMMIGKRSAYDLAYKILSKDDLEIISTDSSLSFTQRYRKNLLKVNSNLEQTLIIDDDIRFAVDDSQVKNFLFLESVKYHIDDPSQIIHATGPFDPQTKSEWFFDKNKLHMVKDILTKSLDQDNFLDSVSVNTEEWDFKRNKFKSGQFKRFAHRLEAEDCHSVMFKFLEVF